MQYFVVLVYFTIFVIVRCTNVTLEGRIVGGIDTDIAKCPYQVSVRYNDSHICGGTIISRNTILTAAHCTDGKDPTLFSIRHGSAIADYGKQHKVTRVIQNPDFNSDYNNNDSSLLKISPPIKFTKSSQPARLADHRSPDNSAVVICGWGVHYEFESTKGLGRRRLQSVSLKTVNQLICQKAYNTPRIGDKLMCAAAEGKDSCQGDSGGGLMDRRSRQIIGISSWGEGCAKEGSAGIYASVPNMMGFIKPNMFGLW